MEKFVSLPDRAVLELAGEDRVSFLQGLVSNDVTEARPGVAVWSAMLSPQGKWLADFFIFATPDSLLLDCEAAQAESIAQRLSRHRLRARVAIRPTAHLVHAGWDGPPPDAPLTAPDPRLPKAGWRCLGEVTLATNATFEEWDRHRLLLGLPDGSRDLEFDKSVLLEAGFDELHGISWDKGCYTGQELTARTRYRGLVKRRLVPVAAEQNVPAPGSPITLDGREIGTMRSGRNEIGLAVLRLEALTAAELSAGEVRLRPVLPAWLTLPAT
jgi:folate-binding protein YgfZ